MKYLVGDTTTDNGNFVPFDDDYMFYDTTEQRYVLKHAAYVKYVGKSPQTEYEGFQDTQEKIWSDEQSQNVYRELLESPYNDIHKQNVLFLIARTERGRNAIFKALISQSKWVLNFDKDLLEDGISQNAIKDLRNAMLWHKGAWCQTVNPDELNVGY